MSDDLEDDDVRRSFKEDMLTCQLCFEVYTDPKLLPCQHSFCEICLEKWVQTKRGQLSCPCCRATCPLPDDGVKCLPRNIMLGSFIDYVVRPEQKRTGDDGIQTCEVCGPGTKTHSRCLDCAQYLCSKCCRVHGKLKMTKGHTLMAIEIYEEEKRKNPSIEQQSIHCDKHADCEISVYCQTCEVATCLKCALKEHPNPSHHYITLEDAAGKEKTHFLNLIQQLDIRKKEIAEGHTYVKTQINKLVSNHQECLKQISGHAAEIRENVKLMEDMAVEKLNKLLEEKQKNLETQLKTLDKTSKTVSSTIEFAQMEINLASPGPFLVLKNEMKFHIDGILSQNVNSEPEESSDLEVTLIGSTAVEDFGLKIVSNTANVQDIYISDITAEDENIMAVGEARTLHPTCSDHNNVFHDALVKSELAASVKNPVVSGARKKNKSHGTHPVHISKNKSRYSRDFLLGLQYHPQSLGKLIGLDHVTKTCPGVLVEETLLDRTAKILEDVMKDYYSLVNAAKNINTPIIITEEGLKAVVNLIYQNATSCPGYVDKFVQLCGHLMNVEVPSKMHFSSTVTFKVILRNKCEEEFQKGCDENKALLNAPNTLQRRNDTQELHVKRLGCVAFIGKLFCFSIIEDEVIIHRYLHTLLADQDQYSLECACKLLSHYVIRNVNSQSVIYDYLRMLETASEVEHIPRRVRIMVQEVVHSVRSGLFINRPVYQKIGY